MKISNLVLGFIGIVIALAIYLYIQNDNREILRAQTESGKMETFDPATRGTGNLTRMPEEYFNQKKKEKGNEILLISGGLILLLIGSYFAVVNSENKKDPVKNLDVLKENKIITQSEYELKVEESRKIADLKKRQAIKLKESNKLIKELENLKEKGILTEQEFNQKLNKIREKTA